MKWVLTMPEMRDPAPRELLDDHRVGRQIEPHAAVLLGDRDAEEPELLHLLDDRLRKLVLVVVVLGVGEDLLLGELAHHLGDGFLLVGAVEVCRAGHATTLTLFAGVGGNGHRSWLIEVWEETFVLRKKSPGSRRGSTGISLGSSYERSESTTRRSIAG